MDKMTERRLILWRFFQNDKRLYELGKQCGISWFDIYERKFSKDEYAFFATEERKEAEELIVGFADDVKFVESLNKVGKPKYMEIDCFIGEHYFFDGNTFVMANKSDLLRDIVRNALKETKERGYFLLKAIIKLYQEGKWDRAYGGATWIDILTKIRELGGSYPSPRDLAILKSYHIYFKTGSRRYPTHTVPVEMIPIISEELEKWKAER
jgi:hypothetical protein